MLTIVLPRDANTPLLARRHVEQFVRDETLDGLRMALMLIASELVTNGVMHGREPIELSLIHGDGLATIEVADCDPRASRVHLRVPERARPGGRGLQVVSSLADRWGVRVTEAGKVVWASLRTATG